MVLMAMGIHHIVQPVRCRLHRTRDLGAVRHIAARR